MSMPYEIELPDAEDFCRYKLFEDGLCCFIGWRIKLLPDMSWEEEKEFDDTALKVAEQMKLKVPEYTSGSLGPGVSNYNDCRKNNKRRLATWFRKTIERLGYDVS